MQYSCTNNDDSRGDGTAVVNFTPHPFSRGVTGPGDVTVIILSNSFIQTFQCKIQPALLLLLLDVYYA